MLNQCIRLGATLGVVLCLESLSLAQLPGLAYTTDRQGVDVRVFPDRRGAFLAGTPRPSSNCTGPGLTDGTYYFQVTDPSGALLLSADALANRRVNVVGGVITGVVAPGHGIADGPCGSKIVQLAPFAPTPVAGGEYRVWLMPTAKYAAGQGAHGFLVEFSKTDTFKVGAALPPQSNIRGTVFYDVNNNGLFDPSQAGETPIPGWKIQIDSNGVLGDTFTDVDGTYQFLRDQDSTTHTLTSFAPPPGFVGTPAGRWVATTPITFQAVTESEDVKLPNSGNFFLINTPQYARSKGYWHNQGEDELQACDPLWRTEINSLCLRTNVTNANGQEGTLFTVSEVAPFSSVFDLLADYLVGPDHGVLAYTLSTQFCAAHLNISCGPLANQNQTTYVDQHFDDVLVAFDQMSAGTHALLCDPRSANTGPDGDQEWRAVIMMCLMEWDGMNSNGGNLYSGSPGRPPAYNSIY